MRIYVNHTVRTEADLKTGPRVVPAFIYTNTIFNEKRVEPVKRKHGAGEQWMVHRFPIKGGISLRDAIIADMSQPNPLLGLIEHD
jgi:hypothetical protein